jgi:hypothetical protein
VRHFAFCQAVGVLGTLLAVACSDRESISVAGRGGGFGVGGGFAAGGSGGTGIGAIGGTGGAGGFAAIAGAVELPTDPAGNGAPLANPSAVYAYDPANCTSSYGFGTACTQYFVCGIGCSTETQCPSGGSGSPDVACIGSPFATLTCVLRCGDGAVCPDGMQCVVTGEATLGSICLLPDYLMQPGCPSWCQQVGDFCSIGVTDECCAGSVCGPGGQCTFGSCLEPGWPCAPGGTACCFGSCQNGVCG